MKKKIILDILKITTKEISETIPLTKIGDQITVDKNLFNFVKDLKPLAIEQLFFNLGLNLRKDLTNNFKELKNNEIIFKDEGEQ